MKKNLIILFTLAWAIHITAEETQKIIICGDFNYPPYEYINAKGEPEGFTVDLIRLVMEELKLPYDLQLDTFKKTLQQFEDGDAKVITNIVKSEERKKKFPLSETISYINYKFVCLKNAPIQTPEELKNKDIIVEESSLPYEKLKAMHYGNLIPVDNMEEGLKLLSAGKGDVAICPDDMSTYLIKKNKLANLDILESGWLHRELCLAVNDPQLLKQIDATILKLKANGIYRKLQDKWFGTEPAAYIPLWVRFLISFLLITAILLYVFVRIYKKRAKRGEELLKKENEKLRFAIQTADMAMWEYDCGTQMFTSYNDPLADYKDGAPISMSAYDQAFEKEGTDWKQLEHATDIMKNRKDESYTFQVKLKTPYDSDWQYCSIRGVPMEKDKSGKVTKYLGIRFNITDQIKYQKVLKQEKEEAQKADKLKSVFLANMSHEIRTPLNAIIGFSELLQSTEDPETRKEFMNIIRNNNELLLRLISDILDLSKIESGLLELKVEKFDMAETFRETFTALKQRCTNPEVKFTGNNSYKSCKIELDKNRMVQVYTNFVTNAIKHTEKGSILMGYEYIDKGIRMYVKDTGSGIPKEKQDRLFQRFAKLDNFTQGTGLGLAISKAILDAQGGKIGMESNETQGSIFWAWFPCEAEIEEYGENNEKETGTTPETNDLPHKDTQEEDTHKPSILVAEDIDSNYLLVKAILKNYRLTHALTGKEAVELAAAHPYDAILMDIKMPVMDGIEATMKIRETDKSTPIIALTANAFDSDREKAIKAGCNAFMTKPLTKKELEEVLRKLIPSLQR